jgi:hypothetical protein
MAIDSVWNIDTSECAGGRGRRLVGRRVAHLDRHLVARLDARAAVIGEEHFARLQQDEQVVEVRRAAGVRRLRGEHRTPHQPAVARGPVLHARELRQAERRHHHRERFRQLFLHDDHGAAERDVRRVEVADVSAFQSALNAAKSVPDAWRAVAP